MLQVYSIEAGALKAMPQAGKATKFGAAHWVDLWDATPEEQQAVERAVGIELQAPDELDQFYISDQVQSSDGQLTLKALILSGLDRRRPRLVPVTFVRTAGPLVSISRGSPGGLAWLMAECHECAPEESKDFFPEILDMIIDHGTGALDHVGSDLDRINRALFQHRASPKRRLLLTSSRRRRTQQLESILTELGYCREVLVKLRRSVLSFRRLVGLLRERVVDDNAIVKKLTTFEHELLSIAEAEVDLSNVAAFMLDGTVGYIGILQSKSINIMTIVGVVLTPPILIASMYGMNFKHMPELESIYGYRLAIAATAVSTAATYFYFKKRGWF